MHKRMHIWLICHMILIAFHSDFFFFIYQFDEDKHRQRNEWRKLKVRCLEQNMTQKKWHTHYFFVSRKLWMFVYICIVSISIIIFNQKKKHHKISGEIISVDFPVFFETMWSFILKVDGPSLCEFDTKYSQSNNYTDLLTTHWKHENIYSYTILYEIRCRYVMLF